MELKPQDLLVLLKVAAHPQQRWTYAALGLALSMSPSETHASVKRAVVSGLVVVNGRGSWSLVRPALLEFVQHGVRYVWPALHGPVKRGVPTSVGTEPLAGRVNVAAGEAPVWAHPAGSAKGPTLSPIYRTAPQAALVDPALHRLLALVDALRVGRARERALAAEMLKAALEGNDATDDPTCRMYGALPEALGDLREQLVFVGGAVAGLLVTDPLSDPVRATRDVDAVVEADRVTYIRIEEAVASRGFARDATSEVICRWVHRESGLLFDLMPVRGDVLGFSNRWYAYAVQTALPVELGGGLVIRCVSAVAFVATKLEAFMDRGAGDFLSSHDLEDVLNIVDGREQLAAEMAAAPAPLREMVATVVAWLVANPDFLNTLPGLIAEPQRADLVLARLRNLMT